MKFPCISNLAASDIHQLEPWDFVPSVPRFNTKTKYKEWLIQESTQHCLYSGFTGVIASLRTHKESNPIHSMHALIADYDSEIEEDEIDSMLQRAGEYAPNWVHMTPSGGVRLVWILSRPVLIATPAILMKTLRMAAKALDMRGLLPGFDFQDAFLNPTIYYDVGRDWMQVEGSKKLPASLVQGWILKSSEGVSWAGPEIPLDIVEKRVREQFPGRWEGPFEEGSRGCRFWDPLADNPTAAIVRPTGMQCFTGPSGFVPWNKIFGNQFVEKLTAERLGNVIDGVWYDSKSYWYQSADEVWESRKEAEMARWLKVEQGLSSDKDKSLTYSEVEQALHMIDQHRRVVGAAPFVYLPPGMIDFMGKRVLNTANVKCIQPGKGVSDWGDKFSWIAKFLEQFFDSEEQLLRFICWLKRFYVSSLEGAPLQGQAVFIAGESGQGKTLLSNRIISGLVGGHQDAAIFLLGGSDFNKNLFHHGLWTVDDATPGDNANDHKKFSSLLKKVTANTTFEYHAKFADATMIEWTGRVVITGNLDAESLRILPDLDVSILDKLMLFKAATVDKKFPGKHELKNIITKELPFFAAFLVDFEIPKECISKEERYGIVGYHHPELSSAAGESTGASVLEEVIETFIADRIRNKESVPWRGTATGLMQELFLDESMRAIVGRNSAQWFSVQLGKLEAQGRGVRSEREGRKKFYILGENQ